MTSYNAQDCTIVFGNTYLTGLGETMVTGEKDEENFSTSVGAQGDVLVNEVNNPLGTITVTLQATSPQRAYLDHCANSGTVQPLWVTNKALGERMGGTKARVKKPASKEFGAEASDSEYEFQVFDYTVN